MIALIAFTRRGCLLGERLAEELGGRLWTTDRLAPETGLPACGKLQAEQDARAVDDLSGSQIRRSAHLLTDNGAALRLDVQQLGCAA